MLAQRPSSRAASAELSRRTLSLIDGCSYQWLVTQDEVSLRLLRDSLVEFLQAQVVPTR